MSSSPIDAFITRWENSGAAERANYQMFLSELCDILEVPRPDPTSPDPTKNLYVFDRAITRVNPDGTTSTNYIDLYKARHFVNETKQGVSDCSVGLRPSLTAGEAPPLVPNGIDGHRPPLQDTIPATKSGHGKRGTAAFDRALERAFHQGRGYITSLPVAEGRPPFLIVCDVGHSIDLYAEFSGTGGHYERFPDPTNHRILLTDLRQEKHRATLRAIWTDPYSLDPSKKAAEVTRDIAGRLAKLAKSLEADRHDPRVIAGFLQRCLFTMFAEDIGLLPEDGFKKLLDQVKASPHGFPVLVSALWKEMATGTAYSALLFKEIACFNGGLFENTTALPLSAAQLAMLTDAASTDWSAVEPSIFGTLLVRALDPRERHKLGAEFTPRSYVERLIRPTIIEPLRDEWDATRIAAANLHREAEAAEDAADDKEIEAKSHLAAGNSDLAKQTGAAAAKLRTDAKKNDAEALKLVTAFHRHLCSLKFLDPACGTANFLYVTLEHLKRLEAEVLELITALGGDATFEMNEYKVRPEQFLGLELSHNAVAIAQLVLWIGYFQWQRKTTGKADTGDRPLLPKTQTIRQQDAVLAYDEKIPRRDPVSGEILTIWNGYTTKTHPVTGKEVPDESATIALFDYVNPRRAEWPQADYIVGNPPFIGNKRLRDALGDGYVEALSTAYPEVPRTVDFVMYWWHRAAQFVGSSKSQGFGLITTNSITQSLNRGLLTTHLNRDQKDCISCVFAVRDHPWVDSSDGASVRIAMTVCESGSKEGVVATVTSETESPEGHSDVELSYSTGNISASLTIGADISSLKSLVGNRNMSFQGVIPLGSGFILDSADLNDLKIDVKSLPSGVKAYICGRDLVQVPEKRWIIDFFGLSEADALLKHPEFFQRVITRVKPVRDQNKRQTRKEKWWLYGENAPKLRSALGNLSRFIGTPDTSKHKPFIFIPANTLPDVGVYAIPSDDAFVLAVLTSTVHQIWLDSVSPRLEDRPRWKPAIVFDPFPFPILEEGKLKQRIRDLGERLDSHRKRQQEQHPGLTLTGIYNVLEKLRSGEPLTAKEKQIHDQGLVTVLRQIHDELDDAVLEAYGWGDLKASTKEAPHSCGASECAAIEKREALPNDTSFASRQECRGSLGASECAAIEKREALPNDTSFASRQECRDSLKDSLLTRLVALNHERAAEEKRGLIRYLRPDYQNPTIASDGHRPPLQAENGLSRKDETNSSSSLSTINSQRSTILWPDSLPEQVAILRKLIGDRSVAAPYDAESLSAHFGRKNKKRTAQIEGILETLKGLGQL